MSTDTRDGERDPVLEEVFYRKDQVKLFYWEVISGARTAVWLTGVLSVVAFVTGLSTLSQETLMLDGPVATLFPGIAGTARFAGVVFGFLLGGVAFGLRRRKRLAWDVAIVVLPLVILLPLTTFRTTDILLFVISVGVLPLLAVNRGQFNRTLDLSSLQIAALSSFVAVLVYGVVGSYAQRQHFGELDTWGDAVYYVIVTIATVGYGDITPTTAETKWFSLSIIMFGTVAFTVVAGSFVAPAIEKRMASAFGDIKPSELVLLEDHVIVLGYSDYTDSVLAELGEDRETVVVTDDPDTASELNNEGINVLTADPTESETLRDAGIDTASGVIVATKNDPNDVLTVLAVKEISPEIRVVAAANDHHNVSKLEAVGADRVISPTELGGRVLGRAILDGGSIESIVEGLTDEFDGDGANAEPETEPQAE